MVCLLISAKRSPERPVITDVDRRRGSPRPRYRMTATRSPSFARGCSFGFAAGGVMQTHLPAMPFRYRIRKLYEGHGEQTRWFLYGLLAFDFASLLFIITTSFLPGAR